MANELAKCLTETCDRPAKVRGVCNTCYVAAQKLVKDGKAIWPQLEELGMVLPPSRSAGRPLGLFASVFNDKLKDLEK